MKEVDRQAHRLSGLIPPEEAPDEGREIGPATSQQMERLYQEQRQVSGCLWLAIIAVALVIAMGLYFLWR